MLAENINCYMSDCARKYFPVYLLRTYRAAVLRVNIIKDNIEMDITKMVLMTSGLNMIKIQS